MYLYGFQQIDTSTDSGLDTTMINAITICLGVMYGVDGAKKALISISRALANGVEKKSMGIVIREIKEALLGADGK